MARTRAAALFAVLMATASAIHADQLVSTGPAFITIRAVVFDTVIVDSMLFAALKRSDGRVYGAFDFHSTYSGLTVHLTGDIECVTITGNQARLGGVVRRTDFEVGIPQGTQVTWSVSDNPGKNPPDMTSQLLGADAAAYCGNGLPYPEYPVTKGKIVILP